MRVLYDHVTYRTYVLASIPSIYDAWTFEPHALNGARVVREYVEGEVQGEVMSTVVCILMMY